MAERGRFVVVEGGSGVGKTTAVIGIAPHLEGNWRFLREPGGTAFGEAMRGAVQGMQESDYKVDKYAALFAYSASRAQLVRQVILPHLNNGVNVFLDRYWYSTIAYQGGGEGISPLIISTVSRIATGGLTPKAVLYYDLDPLIAERRKTGKTDLDRYDMKDPDFHYRVRRNYNVLGKFLPKIWHTIDASQSADAVIRDSLDVLEKVGIKLKKDI